MNYKEFFTFPPPHTTVIKDIFIIVYVVKGKERGEVWQQLLFQILKTVVHIGDVALDKSVPTPLPPPPTP